jgi:hypothetical protein
MPTDYAGYCSPIVFGVDEKAMSVEDRTLWETVSDTYNRYTGKDGIFSGSLIANTITSMYGARRINQNEITKKNSMNKGPYYAQVSPWGESFYYSTMKADPTGKWAVSDADISSSKIGVIENFYGIEINAGVGEGVVDIRTTDVSEVGPPISAKPDDSGGGPIVAGSTDVAGAEISDALGRDFWNRNYDRQDKKMEERHSSSPLATYAPEKLKDLPKAVAIDDGYVVEVGYITTDNPYEEAYVIIKHDKKYPDGSTIYSYYGGLYGCLRLPDPYGYLARGYNANRSDYVKLSPPVSPPQNLGSAFFGPGKFNFRYSETDTTFKTYSNQYGNSVAESQNALGIPLVADTPRTFGVAPPADPVGINYYYFPSSVFNPKFEPYMYLDTVGPTGASLSYRQANPLVPGEAGMGEMMSLTAPAYKTLIADTALNYKVGSREDYQKAIEDLIKTTGMKVKKGQFIGYIGGGVLDPGAGQKEQEKIVGPFTIPGLSELVNELMGPLRTIKGSAEGVANTLDAVIPDGAPGDLITRANSFKATMKSIADKIPENDADLIDMLREIVEGPLKNANNIVKGINRSSERHLNFMILTDYNKADYEVTYIGANPKLPVGAVMTPSGPLYTRYKKPKQGQSPSEHSAVDPLDYFPNLLDIPYIDKTGWKMGATEFAVNEGLTSLSSKFTKAVYALSETAENYGWGFNTEKTKYNEWGAFQSGLTPAEAKANDKYGERTSATGASTPTIGRVAEPKKPDGMTDEEWNALTPEQKKAIGGGTQTFGKDLANILNKYVFPPVVGISIVWCIWIGVQFGMATDEGKRANAKARLIKAIATVFIIAACYAIMLTIEFTADAPGKPKGLDITHTIDFPVDNF